MSGLKGYIVNTGKTPAEDVMVTFTFHFGTMTVSAASCTASKDSWQCEPPNQYEMRNFQEDHPIDRVSIGPISEGVVAPDSECRDYLQKGPSSRTRQPENPGRC